MRVLLTGATGFVGARVLERLVERGDAVNVVALPETVDDVRHSRNVRIFAGSLDDFEILEAATEGVEVVYHAAGVLPGAPPRELVRVNVHGSENVLLTAAAARCRRVVFTSSTAVYAPGPPRLPIEEDFPLRQTPQGPIGGYGRSKVAAEEIFHRFHRRHRLESAILRAPMVYGRGARVADPLVKGLAGWPPALVPRRPRLAQMQWVHVEDMADAMILAGTRPQLTDDTFNVAGAEVFSLADVSRVAHGVDGQRLGVADRPRGRPWHSPWSLVAIGRPLLYDISHAEEVLGYRPRVTLDQGVHEILQAPNNGGWDV